jgi:hypothetical protein
VGEKGQMRKDHERCQNLEFAPRAKVRQVDSVPSGGYRHCFGQHQRPRAPGEPLSPQPLYICGP